MTPTKKYDNCQYWNCGKPLSENKRKFCNKTCQNHSNQFKTEPQRIVIKGVEMFNADFYNKQLTSV